MKCPFCNQNMEEGSIVVAGHAGIVWEKKFDSVSLRDRLLGKNRINDLSFGASKVNGHRCDTCDKIILNLDRKKI